MRPEALLLSVRSIIRMAEVDGVGAYAEDSQRRNGHGEMRRGMGGELK